MCGIAGYFGPNPPTRERIAVCQALMRHRGPYADGVYRRRLANGREVVLLHSRLAIIGLDPSGNQPFARSDRVIVYNGEIYNYLELRRRLEAGGVQFTTATDTEVLIQGLAEWGADTFLDAAEGMWAFACYDESSQSLLLSRDRFGEKPLYLARDDRGGLYFGSEIKFLSALRGRAFAPNLNHVRRYLVNGYKALYKTNETFLNGVAELPPRHCLQIAADGREDMQAYWHPRPAERPELTFEEAAHLVRERLIDAVNLRLRADVPLAFCMSGGVDSNALIAIAKRVFGYDVHGFTILNSDGRYDEADLVADAVSTLEIRHTGVPLDSCNFLPHLRALVRAHDAPIYTLSYFVHWRLMEQIAKAGYKVSVSGTGADELFTGYYDHHNLYLAEIRNEPGLYANALQAWQRHVQPVVRNPFLGDPERFVANPGFRDHIYLGAEGFAADLIQPWSEPFDEARLHPGNLRNRMLNELFHESVPVILHEDDLNAMYFSIENRSPFLDRGLFEIAQTIPTRHLIKNGYAKAVLREAVRGIAPDSVLDSRRKVGFNAPLLDLLDLNDPATRAEIEADSPVYDVVRRDRVLKRLENPDLPNSESKFLFNVLNVKMFLEECGAERT
jgi:asparagine synthase (glutamine-hydrolysing)